jgi:polyphenol oxidase
VRVARITLIEPTWPAPRHVRACSTTRLGGVSDGRFASFNLATHVGDRADAVAENRRRLRTRLGLAREPRWLAQAHGRTVAHLDPGEPDRFPAPVADAAIARGPGPVCAILSADCLPVLLCERTGLAVAAVHAGWRGLAAGVIEACVAELGLPPGRLLAWIGPGVGASAYVVGREVRDALAGPHGRHAHAFRPCPGGRWLADLPALARARLHAAGIAEVYGGALCTASDPDRFFSYRRDGETGRMATLIWITSPAGATG